MERFFSETIEQAKIINLKTVSHLTCDITLRSDDIVKIDFKEIEELKLEHAEDIFRIIRSFNPEKRHLILINLSHYINPTAQVREFWAAKERSEISLAEAILLDNFSMNLIVNFYLTVNKPNRSTKTFKNEHDAIDWLIEQGETDQKISISF